MTSEDGYPAGNWLGRPRYAQYGSCAMFLMADSALSEREGKPAIDPDAGKILAISGAKLLVRDRGIAADAAGNQVMAVIRTLQEPMTTQARAIGAAEYRDNCAKLQKWMPPSTVNVPDEGFLALKIPRTAPDTRVAATETGLLGLWSGHAVYEVYGWCSALMTVASQEVGQNAITGANAMARHATRIAARDRGISLSAANALLKEPIVALQGSLAKNGIMDLKAAPGFYLTCNELEGKAAAAEK